MNKKERRVVITGLGPLSSAGIGVDALWKGILAKDTGLVKEDLYVDGKFWDSCWYHKIGNFNIAEFGIKKEVLEDISNWKAGKNDRDLQYLLAAVKLAIDDSKITYNRERNNIGLFVTVEHPGFEAFCEEVFKESARYFKTKITKGKAISVQEAFRHLYEKFAPSGYDLHTFMYLFFLAKTFNLHGYSLFTNNACASGLFAIESAVRQIKFGGSDIAVVAGGDYPCTIFKQRWFKKQNLYASDGKIKPFAKDANGLVLGDGASAIILEEFSHAKKRQAHIYAEYLGGGFSLEGWKVTLPQLGSAYYQDALKTALRTSKLNPKDIDLINPHGVGIKITDKYEAEAITDIFGKNPKKPLVTAFKPYIGHNLGGSALIDVIILLLAMKNSLIPATLNTDPIETKYNINLVKKNTISSIRNALKLSCGFAGYNGAVVFKKHE